ncbi:MAG: transposase [Pseudonocardiaceae bacterium]
MARHKSTAAAQGAWLVFEDEAGQNLRPPHGRTWGRRGHTPVVKVRAASSGRVSIAGLVATKPDHPTRLIFRTRVHRGRKGEKKGFTERDYAALLDSAHQRLGGPIVLVWDNLNTHLSAVMRRLATTREWRTVYQLPAYAPELNPVEAVWSHLKRSLANLTKRTVDQLLRLIKTRLRRIQHRPELTAGFVAKIGLDFKPP